VRILSNCSDRKTNQLKVGISYLLFYGPLNPSTGWTASTVSSFFPAQCSLHFLITPLPSEAISRKPSYVRLSFIISLTFSRCTYSEPVIAHVNEIETLCISLWPSGYKYKSSNCTDGKCKHLHYNANVNIPVSLLFTHKLHHCVEGKHLPLLTNVRFFFFFIIIIISNLRTASFKAYCAIWVRCSNLRHQTSSRVSPRESTQRGRVELW
jgi:hypothetical protein